MRLPITESMLKAFYDIQGFAIKGARFLVIEDEDSVKAAIKQIAQSTRDLQKAMGIEDEKES